MRRDNPDRSAKQILENLRKDGWIVHRIARAVDREAGIPDAIASRYPARKTHLLELKSPGGHMTYAQIEFAKQWPSCVHCGSSSWELNLLLTECEKRA